MLKRSFSKMKKSVVTVLIAVLILLLASCTTFKATGLAVYEQQGGEKFLGHFEKEVTVTELLGISGGANILNITASAMDDKIQKIVQDEIAKKGGNAALNVEIEYKTTLIDLIINEFTASILAPAHLVVSGDVILIQ